MPYPTITKSNELWARSQGLIPAGTQTLAKGPGQWSEGVSPKYAVRGKGARVWDVDGNEYVDLIMAVGPVSLGYCYPAVDEAIKAISDLKELQILSETQYREMQEIVPTGVFRAAMGAEAVFDYLTHKSDLDDLALHLP